MTIAPDDTDAPDRPNGATRPVPSSELKRAMLAKLLAESKARSEAKVPGFVELFAAQADRTPEAIALRAGTETITYAALKTQAEAFAERVRAGGGQPGAVVGLAMSPGIARIAALIGILQADCVFLPLEPDDAPQRLQHLQTITNAALILADGSDTRHGDGRPAGIGDQFALMAPDHMPITISRRAITQRLAWLRATFPLSPADVSVFASSLNDISAVVSLFWPLTTGAEVVLANATYDPVALVGIAAASGATVAVLPVNALGSLDAPRLRLLFLDREPVEPSAAGSAAVHVLWLAAEIGGPVLAQPLGSGAPLVSCPVEIVDRHGQPVPSGGIGTLATSPTPGAPMINLGIRARLRADGRYERRPDDDRRLNVGGMRVSLASIESALRGAAGILDCRVIERLDTSGAARLVAYVVSKGSPALDAWNRLAEMRLAPWQRPGAWVAIANMPLTEAGGIDDEALVRLPVLDDAVTDAWVKRLGALAGVTEAAVVVRPVPVAESLVAISRIPPIAPPVVLSALNTTLTGPPALADGGPLAIPDGVPRTLTAALMATAERSGTTPLWFYLARDRSERMDYATLLTEARAIAGGLVGHGLKPGDRAILQIASTRAHLPAFWGCVLAGVQPVTIAVSATYATRTALVAKLLNAWDLLGRPVVLAPAALAPRVQALDAFVDAPPHVLTLETLAQHAPIAAIHAAKPDDILFIQLSSGSTGIPKCIQITHRGVVDHIHATRLVNGYGGDDISLNWLPMDHVVPMLTWHLRDTYLGIAQVDVDTSAVLADPLLWLDVMDRHAVTRSWAPNFGFKLLCEAIAAHPDRTWTLGSLKTLMNAGEQATYPVIAEFLGLTERFGIRPNVMQPAFGMAEACTCMTYETGFDLQRSVNWIDKASLSGTLRVVDRTTPGAVGFVKLGAPVPGVAIRIVDADNTVLPEGVIGRFQIKGGVITPGYAHNDTANEAAFVGDDWFNSGDLGFILGGNLTLTGREKEIIIVNGANFYCYEIEDIVNAVPGVVPTFAAACGLASSVTGSEALAIFFAPRNSDAAGATIDAIRAAVTERFAIAPAHVVPVVQADFPKTSSGKIQRIQLRDRLLTELAETHPQVPAWFHRQIWVRRELDAGLTRPRRLAILGGSAEAERLAGMLATSDVRIEHIAADDDAALIGLLAETEAPVEAIVDLRPSAALPATGSIAARASRGGRELAAALSLVQMLARVVTDSGRRIGLTVVTRNGAGCAEPTDPARAALIGLLRTAEIETPSLACRVIDLAGDLDPPLVRRLADEILCPDGEPQVALNPGSRRVPRLVPIDPNASSGGVPVRLKIGGRYLVTGGLGGIGRALVRHLSTTCNARILVIGRAAVEDRGAEIAAIERSAPGLIYAKADVTDAQAVECAIANAEHAFGGPLDGMFHLSGIAGMGSLVEASADDLMSAFAPKAIGATALQEAMSRRPGGFLVLWSSVNALFGGAHAGAYSAASAGLAGLPENPSVTTLCLHWSRWQDTGMSADDVAAMGAAEFAASRGFRTMPVEAALASLDAALAMGVSPLAIGLAGANANVAHRLAGSARPLQQLAGFVVTGPGTTPTIPANDDLADRFGTPIACPVHAIDTLPRDTDGKIDAFALTRHEGNRLKAADRPRDSIEDQLAAIWSELLARPRIARDDNFFLSGGHSLVAARLVYRVREVFGVDLPLRILFEAPTLAGMAGWISAATTSGKPARHIPDCLVPVQPEGDKPPLYCVHPGGGSPWCYVFLAQSLGLDQPLYGFQAPGLVDDQPMLQTVEDMARLYADAVIAWQPEGPYRIAAWSSGGPVAFEIARLLIAGGHRVVTLAFFDCAVMETDNVVRSKNPLVRLKGVWQLGVFLTQVRFPRNYHDFAALTRLVGLSLPASWRDVRLNRALLTSVGRSLRMFNVNTLMGYRYRPQRLTTDAVLFRAGSKLGSDDPLQVELDAFIDGRVTRVDLAGNHMSILLDPDGAAALAEALKPHLTRSDASGNTRSARSDARD